MRERIKMQKDYYTNERGHWAKRVGDVVDPSTYQIPGCPAHRRTALRLRAMLEAETPVIEPFERIVVTRTVHSPPMIFTGGEWARIKSQHYIHELGNVCNLCPDYAKVISRGLVAIREGLGDSEYDESVRISIDAILDFATKYSRHAQEIGRDDIGEIMARVPAYAPRTFQEALQSLRVLHFVMWCEGSYHNTLGRLDQYMYPYFESDLENGRIGEEDALELIQEFFLSCNRDSDLYPGMQLGDNGQSIVLGGMTPLGENGYNRLSELCLQASSDLLVIDPKINLRVDGNTPLSVFELGTKLTKLGLGFPQYANDDVVIPGLEALGYETEDARNYVVAACWEFIIPGRGMDIPNIGAVPIAAIVDQAVRVSLRDGKMFEDILTVTRELFVEHVQEIAQNVQNLYVIPAPYLSLFFDVKTGADISDGSIYNNYGLHGTGISTAVDSLAAVEEMVYKRNMDSREFLEALEQNFEGHAQLLYTLRYECPKMGNDDDAADKYASILLDIFADSVNGLENERGGIYRAGTGAAMYYIWHAEDMNSTADGRLRGTPLAANFSPSLNVKLNGPLSVIHSFTKPKLHRTINGGPLTIEFHDSVFRNDEAIAKVAKLVKTYIDNAGHQLQLNTVNVEELKDAQRNPERHRNLIVRVWGWSGYFVELDKCYQDHIIQRVELRV
jgi:formate C-acetyltransferase